MSEDQMQMLMLAYPWIVGILAGLKIADMIFRPLSDLAQKYVDSTVDTGDDEILVKVKKSKVYQVVDYILGWAAGIKLPQKKIAVQVAEPVPEKAA